MVNVHVQHFDLYQLPESKLTNANILCLVRFGSARNKLVQLLIRSRTVAAGPYDHYVMVLIYVGLHGFNTAVCSGHYSFRILWFTCLNELVLLFCSSNL